jgi:hypothetical protein
VGSDCALREHNLPILKKAGPAKKSRKTNIVNGTGSSQSASFRPGPLF